MQGEYEAFDVDNRNQIEMDSFNQIISDSRDETNFYELQENIPEEDEIVVKIRNLHKTYLLGLEGVPALRGVSLEVHRGEFLCILGKSGGGKTSLLNCIGTIDKPTKGDLYICGKRVSSKTPDREVANLRLHNIGFCFQTFNLIASMTAVENVELPMILAGDLTANEIRERALSLLEQVGLRDRANHLPSQLSGGEQQRVTISRAISNNPDILLLDEPTGDLDTKNTCNVVNLLLELNRKQNMTLVLVTHDVSLKQICNRVVHMSDGKISRIELISESQREEAKQNITDNLISADIKEEVQREIEIRNPSTHYAFHRFAKKYKAQTMQTIDLDSESNCSYV